LHLVLLSGGSGKRLWPLSNDSRSKQFLKVLPSIEGSSPISMVQRVWHQLEQAKLQDKTVIATSKSQVDMLRSQLGQVPLVIEPSRRDTYPAIALASTYLYSVKGVTPEEVVTIMPVDPFVEVGFFHHVAKLEEVLQSAGADLALIGIKPIFPSEKYGYIVPETSNVELNHFMKVHSFREKPDMKTAQDLISKGALWNGGVFSFKLGFILNHLKSRGLPLDYEKLSLAYQQLPKISFDYEVVEKTNHIVVLPYEGSWKDLGTWNTLTEEMETPIIGKGIISTDCQNANIINELDIPVALLGLSNVVVAVSPDGILVTDKDASPRVKEIANQFEQRPMYEERRWGWYRVLDYTKFDEGIEVLTKRIGVKAGKNLSYQKHFKRNETWTVIRGEGLFVLNGKITEIKPGDVLHIPVGAEHAIKAITDVEFIEVQTGSELTEEDIIRIYMNWQDIENHCKVEKG